MLLGCLVVVESAVVEVVAGVMLAGNVVDDVVEEVIGNKVGQWSLTALKVQYPCQLHGVSLATAMQRLCRWCNRSPRRCNHTRAAHKHI